MAIVMHRVLTEFDVAAPMRDGTVLRANVYRPEANGCWPVLLCRSPYGKDLVDLLPRLDPVRTSSLGFVVVIQDTRGRFASEGEWEPFRYERQDGFDSVEWAARLPGADGRVAMYGDSYFGNTQWMAAAEAPPSLVAIAPAFTWFEPMDGLFARGGATELGLGLAWSLRENASQLIRTGSDPSRVNCLLSEYESLGSDGYWQLPVSDMRVLKRHDIDSLSLLRGVVDPEFADWARVADHCQRVRVPVLNTAGWYDLFLQGALDSWAEMNHAGREIRLVIGPWAHTAFSDPVGDRRFGHAAGRYGGSVFSGGDMNQLQLAWFRFQMDETPDPFEDGPIRLFVMGRNVWRSESHWPPTRSTTERWFLRADGGLTRDAPASDAPAIMYDYDPRDPVPTLGGCVAITADFPAGAVDQSAIESRPDVVSFTSAPLEHQLEVTGRVTVVLHARSTGVSTDWVARLCDVCPDGRSIILCDGIVRVADHAVDVRRYEVDLWSTSNVFLEGHRLRVHITSSSFPRWDRNLNTGDQSESASVVVRQTICLDIDHPSYINLPTLPERRGG